MIYMMHYYNIDDGHDVKELGIDIVWMKKHDNVVWIIQMFSHVHGFCYLFYIYRLFPQPYDSILSVI